MTHLLSKISLLVTIFAVATLGNLSAQSYKVIYEMTWKPTKEATEYNKELTALIIDSGKESYFMAYDKFREDSLATQIIYDYERKQSNGPLGIPIPKNTYKYRSILVKNIVENVITQEEKLFAKRFAIKHQCKPEWTLKKEAVSDKILGYSIKKATVRFGGRDWVAYYTPEIPIQDGPYKFFGLPGLILKIEDTGKNYAFEIKAIEKGEYDISRRSFGEKTVALTSQQWDVFWKKYKAQPSMILENLNTERTTYVYNGEDVSKKSVKDDFNQAEWKKIKHFENPIELKNSCK